MRLVRTTFPRKMRCVRDAPYLLAHSELAGCLALRHEHSLVRWDGLSRWPWRSLFVASSGIEAKDSHFGDEQNGEFRAGQMVLTSLSKSGCRSSTLRSFTKANGGLVLPFS